MDQSILSVLGWVSFIVAVAIAPTRLVGKMMNPPDKEDGVWMRIFAMVIAFPFMGFVMWVMGFTMLWIGKIMLQPVVHLWSLL